MQHAGPWRIGAPITLRDWDGDYAVFNPLSGSTHLLDIVSGEVLRALQAGPATTAVVCEHVARFLGVENDERVTRRIAGVLAELDQLGLIEPAPHC
jgi:PqqD family protein of HPr-rel-A system